MYSTAFADVSTTGAEGAGTADETLSLALFQKPLSLSTSGICSSARARAGRARTSVDEKRMLAMWWREDGRVERLSRVLKTRASGCLDDAMQQQ